MATRVHPVTGARRGASPDPPRNRLDLPATEQLEQRPASYDGTPLLVSHARSLRDVVHLACLGLDAARVSIA